MTHINSILLTDLYELTMAAGYFHNNYNPRATFELFVRQLPRNRNYLVFSGLEQVLDFIEKIEFTEDEIEYLQQQTVFKDLDDTFWQYLKNFKFTGEIHGIREGEIVFGGEPLIRITAPLIESQILETFLLSTINFQTAIASKAARVVSTIKSAERNCQLMEFGSRRAHGPQAGMLAARAAYIAGFDGTSNVLAGKEFKIPVFGTAAHSWTMAFRDELKAFRAYYNTFPESTTLLIDTFNTTDGIDNAIKIGKKIKGVRIDSGDLLEESIKARKQLDEAGMTDVKIILSGDLDEFRIQELLSKNTPADSFGVGTRLSVSADAPYLGGIYKLVQLEAEDQTFYTAKFSKNKATYPGKKQVFRETDNQGIMVQDIIGLEDENIQGEKLLTLMYENGKRFHPVRPIQEIQRYCSERLNRLPVPALDLSNKFNFCVKHSDKLLSLFTSLNAEGNSDNG